MIKIITGLVSTNDSIEKRFNRSSLGKITHLPDYNIRPGDHTLFLSSSKPNEFKTFRYGMVCSGTNEERIIFEIPIEAPWRKIHDEHILRKDIISSPDFRRHIRGQRGLMPVDYFIVETEKDPCVIYMRNRQRPFALGCVWDAWKKNILDDLTYGFAILTVPAYGIFKQIGIERMPLIIPEGHYQEWVDPDPTIMSKTKLMDYYPEEYLDTFPISNEILTSCENLKSLISPVGKQLVNEEKEKLIFNSKRKKRNSGEIKISLGERSELTGN